MHELIKRFEGVSDQTGVKFPHFQHVFELVDHTVENSDRDLHGVNFAAHGVLEVGVAHLQRLVHNVMFVRLHLARFKLIN